MQPQPDIDLATYLATDDGGAPVDSPRPFRARLLLVLWPAFMMAGLLEALVFVVVDPAGLHGWGSALVHWPATAVYSLAFLVFWLLMSCAAAITLWLDRPGPWQATP
jgi:hypothetical protein